LEGKASKLCYRLAYIKGQPMKRFSLWVWIVSTIGLAVSNPLLADSLRVNLLPEELGPFPPNAGGYITLNVALELYDSEGDGADTQGIATAFFDLLTNTGMTIPGMTPAPTGEPSVLDSATVDDTRFEPTEEALLEPLFIGGYGFDGPTYPFGGTAQDDDRVGIGAGLPMVWEADVEPNVPGLQPYCLAGVGYGERPAGGDWLFAIGQIPIPLDPGDYTVESVPTWCDFILDGVDLRIDHGGEWRDTFGADQLVGDSFSFTVLPEPGGLVLGLMGALLIMRRRRAI
jgi:hypothetical protein